MFGKLMLGKTVSGKVAADLFFKGLGKFRLRFEGDCQISCCLNIGNVRGPPGLFCSCCKICTVELPPNVIANCADQGSWNQPRGYSG